jgi:CheY-like chemotaxis protein
MGEAASKTVLVVDDEQDVRRFMQMALEDAGFTVVLATNGVEALAKVEEHVPDLISLDLVMPGGSGIKFHRALRKRIEWSSVPVLVVTGHVRDDIGKADLGEMAMSGPGIYLEKPITATKYVDAVKRMLGMAEGEGEEKTTDMRDEAKALLDSSDPETLRKVMDLLKNKPEE